MRVVFFGTPGFAVPALKALISSGHEISAVVTQPDRPHGRGRHVSFSPVKSESMEAGLDVIQPERVNDAGFIEELRSLSADIIVTAAYGQILPSEIIDMPDKGCINIHPSLLPKYRGASPVNQAIIDGEVETGVTTMLMDEGMDTGDILLQKSIGILPDETAGGLSGRLSEAGAGLMLETLEELEKGGIVPRPQNGDASFAPLRKKSDGLIQWARTARELYDFTRGMNPWPCAHTFLGSDMIKILRTEAVDGDGEAGTVIRVDKKALVAGTGSGLLSILEVQPPGKRAMDIRSFLQGRKIQEGTRFYDKPVE